jgi:hypothetical protein
VNPIEEGDILARQGISDNSPSKMGFYREIDRRVCLASVYGTAMGVNLARYSRLDLHIDRSLHAALREAARSNDRTISAEVREALNNHLARNAPANEQAPGRDPERSPKPRRRHTAHAG